MLSQIPVQVASKIIIRILRDLDVFENRGVFSTVCIGFHGRAICVVVESTRIKCL